MDATVQFEVPTRLGLEVGCVDDQSRVARCPGCVVPTFGVDDQVSVVDEQAVDPVDAVGIPTRCGIEKRSEGLEWRIDDRQLLDHAAGTERGGDRELCDRVVLCVAGDEEGMVGRVVAERSDGVVRVRDAERVARQPERSEVVEVADLQPFGRKARRGIG